MITSGANPATSFIRDEEVLLGVQRIHDPDWLLKKAKRMDVNPSTI